MSAIASVCVFCGASPGGDPIYRAAAEAMGREIAGRSLRLVYGGAKVGLMGAVADAALGAGAAPEAVAWRVQDQAAELFAAAPPPPEPPGLQIAVPSAFPPLAEQAIRHRDPERFATLVAAAFAQRRKMLRNNLKGVCDEAFLVAQGIAPTARAEELSVGDYLRMANALS